ncbi:MAG: DMT family transporter [Pseudolabrys sp.]|nr:DMT family transporter [Pseudolabrys sp.]MDP2296746.1 DMT family transporter [Pseudolabrys sp.]
MPGPALTIDRQSWLLLICLSVLWGGSFFFVAVALREMPPTTLALARVAFAAAFIYPIFKVQGGNLPTTLAGWKPFVVMGLFNNIIPFTLIFAGQARIASGLASVLNATTPLFALLVLASFGEERLILRRVVGVLIGLAGVYVLRDPDLVQSESQTIGMLLCLGGALSYGFAGLWGRRNFNNVPPLTTTTCQLIWSSVIMAVIASAVDQPWHLPMPGFVTWSAVVGLAALSTALGYILFFKILAQAGAANVMLVTLLIPVTAILLGVLVLGEPLLMREIAGALVIAASLLVIDGRVLGWAKSRLAGA